MTTEIDAAAELLRIATRISPVGVFGLTLEQAASHLDQFIDDVANALAPLAALLDVRSRDYSDPDDYVSAVASAAVERVVQQFVDDLDLPLHWSDVSPDAGSLVRAAQRQRKLYFDDYGRLDVNDGSRPGGVPFFVFGEMLRDMGKLHPAFDSPGLFTQVHVEESGVPQNAQQALITALWNASGPLTTEALAQAARLDVDDLAAPLKKMVDYDIISRDGAGSWFFVRNYTNARSCSKRYSALVPGAA